MNADPERQDPEHRVQRPERRRTAVRESCLDRYDNEQAKAHQLQPSFKSRDERHEDKRDREHHEDGAEHYVGAEVSNACFVSVEPAVVPTRWVSNTPMPARKNSMIAPSTNTAASQQNSWRAPPAELVVVLLDFETIGKTTIERTASPGCCTATVATNRLPIWEGGGTSADSGRSADD